MRAKPATMTAARASAAAAEAAAAAAAAPMLRRKAGHPFEDEEQDTRACPVITHNPILTMTVNLFNQFDPRPRHLLTV